MRNPFRICAYTFRMAVFEYRARDRSGKKLTSRIQADTLAQVRDNLHSKDLMILDIKPARTGLQGDVRIPLLTDRPPGLKQVALFSKQMSTLINAGVPLVQALAIMQRQIENKTFRTLLRAVRADVESGTPLSEAMARYPKGCVALTGRTADGRQGWPKVQATPAATADHVWNARF